MFSFFERLLAPTAAPENPEPPSGLVAFFWHYARQAKGLFIGLFVAGFFVALLDSLIPVFVGRVVTLITTLVFSPNSAGGAPEMTSMDSIESSGIWLEKTLLCWSVMGWPSTEKEFSA